MRDIIIREALPTESLIMAEVRLSAFEGIPLMEWLGRDVSALGRTQRDAMLNGHKKHYVAIDQSAYGTAQANTHDGQIIGLMIFSRESKDHTKLYEHRISSLQWLDAQLSALHTYGHSWFSYLRDRQGELEHSRRLDILYSTLEGGKQTALKDNGVFEFIDLSILTVDPKFQGRGVGKSLLAIAFQHARDEDVPVWLESTPAGFPVYIKTGFKETGCIMKVKDGDKVIEELPGMLWKSSENVL